MSDLAVKQIESFLAHPPFGLRGDEKRRLMVDILRPLIESHRERCELYGRFLDAVGYDTADAARGADLESLPFLPVRMFKEYTLRSVAQDAVVKQLTSSGTTGQQVSRIFLDRETAAFQTLALVRIMHEVLGPKRTPMIILDTKSVLKSRSSFSARGAGILGIANFGRNHFYALDDDMRLNVPGLTEFLERFRGERILLFGFTFMVWEHFYKAVIELAGAAGGPQLDLSQGILIHSGGWKKLVDQHVDNATFKSSLERACGITDVFNFYGMVEQVGSIFLECTAGHLHAPAFSEVIVRDARDWSPLPTGRSGVIEVLSVLPWSYPGNVLLTEDVGTILGQDDCACGRWGAYFRVEGRVPQAEVRGCSDTHATDWSAT